MDRGARRAEGQRDLTLVERDRTNPSAPGQQDRGSPVWTVRSILIVLGLWHLYAILTLAERHLIAVPVEDFAVVQSAVNLTARAWLWSAYTIGLGYLTAGPLSVRTRRLPTVFAGHIALMFLLQGTDSTLDLVRMQVLFGLDYAWIEMFRSQFMLNVGLYSVTVLSLYLVDHLSLTQQAELRAERLHSLRSRAELDKLRMQLHPHFLFNTLHSISEVVHQDPDLADRMCTRLGDLLRVSLENRDRAETTLEAELRTLAIYVEIQQMRFGDRLRVVDDVRPRLRGETVPTLILQPLVENSIKHGFSSSDEHIEVRVSAVADEDTLSITVADSGHNQQPSRGLGIGLENLRSRLVEQYGDSGALQLVSDSSGTRVSIRLPRRSTVDAWGVGRENGVG